MQSVNPQLPESTEEIIEDRIISDIQAVSTIVDTGLNIDSVEITKVIRPGGRGQNKSNKHSGNS